MEIGGNFLIDLARDSYRDVTTMDLVPFGDYPEKFRIVSVHRDQQLKIGWHEPTRTLLALCRGTARLGDWIQDLAAAAHLDIVANESTFYHVDQAGYKLQAKELVIVGHSLGGWLGFNLHGRVSMPVRSYLFEPYIPGILLFLRYHHDMEIFASAHDPVVNGLVGSALVHYKTHAFYARRATWHINSKPEPEWKINDVTKFVNHSLDQWRQPMPEDVTPSMPAGDDSAWPDIGPGKTPDGDSAWPDIGPGKADGDSAWPDIGPGKADGDSAWPDIGPGKADSAWPTL